MADPFPNIMTIEEASQYLRIPVSSLYRLAQRGKIPCQKVGRHWRFRKETINKWLDETVITHAEEAPPDEKDRRNLSTGGC